MTGSAIGHTRLHHILRQCPTKTTSHVGKKVPAPMQGITSLETFSWPPASWATGWNHFPRDSWDEVTHMGKGENLMAWRWPKQAVWPCEIVSWPTSSLFSDRMQLQGVQCKSVVPTTLSGIWFRLNQQMSFLLLHHCNYLLKLY